MEEKLIEAHLGVDSDGKNHLREFPSVVCSQCSTTFINFKITKSEYEKFKRLLTDSQEEEDKKDLPVIGEVDFNKVKPLDTIYVKFGYDYVRAIIKRVPPTGIAFTLPTWLKEATSFLSFDEIKDHADMPPFMGKRYSKMRWFLKL